MAGKVAIVMGSKSDAEIMSAASEMLTKFGVENETFVMSAHRNPQKVVEFATNAEDRGFEVIIAGAGMAAHLPGVIAGLTCLPVIGVPTRSAALSGMDSLLSIVQMPGGVPVATVAIDGAKNAGILAAQILSVKHPELRTAIKEFKESLRQ
ncbi:MAG: 5-(carboxyamino)imidazole ribonucleotide mutase [Armatimonadota bacterium]|jgi:5-(carboxyamino)imidazole ribonucleotide mutase